MANVINYLKVVISETVKLSTEQEAKKYVKQREREREKERKRKK